MSDRLFRRAFRVTINEAPTASGAVETVSARVIETGTLRVEFKVKKKIMQDTLNHAEVTIYNLSTEHRALLQRKNAPLLIEAGYEDKMGAIFHGQVTMANHIKQGPDWVTKFLTIDGVQPIQGSFISQVIPSGGTLIQGFKAGLKALGIGSGNVESELAKGTPNPVPSSLEGIALHGPAIDVMYQLAAYAGFNLSIQDNVVQLLRPEGFIGDLASAVLLDDEHGLVGNAEEGENSEFQSIVVARSLLNSSLQPGVLVQLTSRVIKTSLFRVDTVNHHGDSMGQNWYSDLELRKVADGP